jgi:hypothetical protein
VTPKQLKARNAAIAEGQRRAWRNPEIHRRRSAAIAEAQDDPLHRAVMSRIKAEGKKMIVRCAVCQRDPSARWVQPPAMVFVDPYRDGDDKHACRDHLTSKREEEIKAREKALGLKTGDLR